MQQRQKIGGSTEGKEGGGGTYEEKKFKLAPFLTGLFVLFVLISPTNQPIHTRLSGQDKVYRSCEVAEAQVAQAAAVCFSSNWHRTVLCKATGAEK